MSNHILNPNTHNRLVVGSELIPHYVGFIYLVDILFRKL